MNKLVPLFLSIFSFNLAFAQSPVFKAEYEILVEESSEEDDLGFLGDNTITYCFSENKSSIGANLMGGFLQTTVIDEFEKDSSILLYSILGDKYLIRFEKVESFDNSSVDYMQLDSVVSITYDESKKKNLLGYSCYLAIATLKNNSKAYFYITEEISTKFPNANISKLDLRGFPMEYYVIAEGVTSGYTIASFSTEEVDCSYDPSLYKEITEEELSEMMNSY